MNAIFLKIQDYLDFLWNAFFSFSVVLLVLSTKVLHIFFKFIPELLVFLLTSKIIFKVSFSNCSLHI